MSSKQLDLFDWDPPVATILAFPQSRNIGRAREVVDKVVQRTNQKSRQSYFDRALRGLGLSLERSGRDAERIDRELAAFTRSVNAELWRRTDGRQRSGGAA